MRGTSTASVGVLGQSAAGSMMYPGIEGESTNNNGFDVAGGFGLTGISGTAPAYGVVAYGSQFAMYGQTTGNGLQSGTYGVGGADASAGQDNMSANSGVFGQSMHGAGVLALSGTPYLFSQYGVGTENGVGLQAINYGGAGPGAIVTSTGTLYIADGASDLLSDADGYFVVDYKGNQTLAGSLSTATINATSTVSKNTEFVHANTDSGYILDGAYTPSGGKASGFHFDQSGNETLTGTLTQSKSSYARTRGASGNERIAYGARTTAPTIEDVGEAQLSNGSAFVHLDPDLADVIDRRLNYFVFITPEGDSNQLYVTQKTQAGFFVREAHGGRSTIPFQYRLVAKPFDEDGRRLAAAPIERPLITTDRFEAPFANPAQIAARHHRMRQTRPVPSENLNPLDRLKARLGPAKFAAALAEFKRQRR